MAGADYYSCDVCGRKAVYDADWYDRTLADDETTEIVGIKIICKTCMVTHEVIVIEKQASEIAQGLTK